MASAEATATIAFFDFKSQQLIPLHFPEKPVANPGLAVSEDETMLLYIQIDQSESDLMQTVIQ